MQNVVHCKREAFDVYIGRPGPWGNPFVIGEDGSRDEVIAKYRSHLWERVKASPEFVSKLASLHGKVLGCYCAPQPCHGDVLVRASAWAHSQVLGDKA